MNKDILTRKERITITAIDLLDEAGITGLTTKEIARRQNISEPAVYKHFDGKKQIILEILARFSAFDEMIKNTILSNNMSGRAGILYFTGAYAEYYQNYPQIPSVMFSFDVFRYDEETNEKMVSIIGNRRSLLDGMVGQAIDRGELSGRLSRQALVDTLFGILWSTTFAWKLGGSVFNLKDRVANAVQAILECQAPGV
jgi:TetR/AcrR family transcriptional regulator, fatty acid metabolism regulator protein